MSRQSTTDPQDVLNLVLAGDVRAKLKELIELCMKFKCIITSPPYLGMRFYGTELQIWGGSPDCSHIWKVKKSRQHAGRGDGQKKGKYSEQEDYPDLVVDSAICENCGAWKGELGQEGNDLQGRQEFLKHLWEICDLLFQVLDDDGTLWFNIGDKRDADGSLLNVPHAFADGMLSRGWIMADDVIWFKRSVLPQSNPTTFSPDYEPIFHFAKRNAPEFYANAFLGIQQREKPPTPDEGEEGVDWRWRRIKLGKKTYGVLKAKVENGEDLGPRFKQDGKDEEGNLIFYVKVSNWQSFTYFHETQYEPYSEASLAQLDKAFTAKSKKHEQLVQTSLFGGYGGQDSCDAKRSIIESMEGNVGGPRYGGKKAAGYGNGTYSGDPWEPTTPDDGPAYGRFMRTTWFPEYSEADEIPSNVWDIIPARYAEAHFATFPVELVQRCLKTSCPEQVCTKCGLGWRKMYSEERKATRPGIETNTGKSGSEADPNEALHNSELSRNREAIIRREVGLMKCKCNAPTVPGKALDPFFGSGTLAVACIQLARSWVGIELNPEYIKLVMMRLKPFMEQNKL